MLALAGTVCVWGGGGVGVRGRLGMRAPPLGPTSFIFMQFSSKILPNSKCWLQNQLLAPPSGISWIRHQLDIT